MGSMGQMLYWSCFCYTSSFALNYFSLKVLAWVYLLFANDATLNPNRNEWCTFFSSWIMNVLGFAEKIRSAAQSFTLRFGELFAKPHIKCTNCDCDIDISNVSSVNYLVMSLWPLCHLIGPHFENEVKSFPTKLTFFKWPTKFSYLCWISKMFF